MILGSVLTRATFMIYLLNVIKEIQQDPMDLITDSHDPVPNYTYMLDIESHSFLIMTNKGPKVNVKLCYSSVGRCASLSPPVEVSMEMNTTHSRSANISFPYLLPCLCVQAYYDHLDAKRMPACPFEGKTQDGFPDVMISSEIRVYNNSKLILRPLCPSTTLAPCAKLCWNNSASLADCAVLPNTTLQVDGLSYDVSDVDKHPQMCIQFSMNNSQHVHCPFKFGHVHQWEVTNVAVFAGHLRLSITSRISASFAGQLCVHAAKECVAIGNEQYVSMEGGIGPVELVLPLPLPSVGLCVQVWRHKPVLRGRRIICLDNPQMHRRWGLIFGAVLFCLLTLGILGNFATSFFCHQLSKRLSGFSSDRPVLLVSSSDEAAHVSAVLALASGLQTELRCSVRLALWDQCASQDSIAHLGPVPWLHAQCQAVLQTGGMVLIAWSSSASATYKWQGQNGKTEDGKRKKEYAYPEFEIPDILGSSENYKNPETYYYEWEEWTYRLREKKDTESHEVTQLKAELQEKALWGCTELCENTSVTAPVFAATLSCVQAALQSGKQSDHFTLLCFQTKGHSENTVDLPAVLHTLPKYYLPQNLPKLVLELSIGCSKRNAKYNRQESVDKKSSWWLWLAGTWWAHHVSWQLARRLQDSRLIS